MQGERDYPAPRWRFDGLVKFTARGPVFDLGIQISFQADEEVSNFGRSLRCLSV